MKHLRLIVVAFVFVFASTSANAQTTQDKPVSLQSYSYQRSYIRHSNGLGTMSEINSSLDRKEATFYLSPGLADDQGISFRPFSSPKSYLRTQAANIKLQPFEDTDAFKKDATFKEVAGLADPAGKSFEAVSRPGYFVRQKAGKLLIDRKDRSAQFALDATFRITAIPMAPVVQTAESIGQKGFSLARASYPDITQGNAGTCWILSSIAALQAKGFNLTKRIHYEGNNQYTVKLYNYNKPDARPAGGMHVRTVTVFFDGKASGADPIFNPSNPRAAWAVIMQRAVVLALHDWDPTQSVETPDSGGAQWVHNCSLIKCVSSRYGKQWAVGCPSLPVLLVPLMPDSPRSSLVP